MTMNNLKDVYTDQLQDLYSACKQSLEATNALGRAAEDKELSEALIDGSNGIAKGMDVLKSICAKHDLDPDAEHCHGMEGLVKEAHKHVLEEDFGGNDARDAMIITQYQRMVHYACLLYTSPSPRDRQKSRMPSSA